MVERIGEPKVELKTEWVEVFGRRFFVRSSGQGDRALMLLHGDFGTSSWVFEDHLKQLGYNFYTITPDRPGHGESEELPFDPKFENQALWLKGLANQLKVERFSLVAHSLAAVLAIKFAIANPERLEKLVLVNPLWRVTDLPRRILRYRSIAKNPITLKLLPTKFLRELVVVSQIDRSRDSSILPVGVRQKIKEGMRRLSRRTLLAFCGEVAKLDLTREVGQIVTPTLILEGDSSRLVKPIASLTLHQKITGSQFDMVANCGHNIPLEKPDIFVRKILDFLKE